MNNQATLVVSKVLAEQDDLPVDVNPRTKRLLQGREVVVVIDRSALAGRRLRAGY